MAPSSSRQEHAGLREAHGESELQRLLLESISDYAVYAIDPEGYVQNWNPGARRLKGYDPSEIIGQHYSRFFTPEDIAAGKPMANLAAARRDGRFEEEGWRVRKDGSRFWANIVLTPLRDARGEIIGFAKVTRDLTQRRAAEEESRRAVAERVRREEADARRREVEELNSQLQAQAVELEAQMEEAQALTEELEQSGEELQNALTRAEEAQAGEEEARAKAEAAAQFTRGILDSISDPFVVQDADWRFRFVNEAAARVFSSSDRRPDALIGQRLWDVYPELVGTVFEREMRRAAADRVRVEFDAFDAERGTWSRQVCYPLGDGGLATQWQDITVRKKAQEAQRFLDRATELLVERLDGDEQLPALARLVVPEFADWCAIDVVDDTGTPRQVAVAHVDPRKSDFARELSQRYPPPADAPVGVPHVLRTGEPELHPEITDEMLVAGAVDDEHLRISRELGLRSAMVVPLSARGQTFGALTFASAESRRRYTADDLRLATELARRAALAVDNARLHREALAARDAAEHASRAKSEFLATMSHELRTPLNAIAGHVDLLLLGIHGPVTEKQADALHRVHAAEQRLLGLINDVLNLARVEAGRIEYRIERVRVAAVLAEVEGLVETQLATKDIRLETHITAESGAEDVAVLADRDRMSQVLLNLLSNAAKFTPRGGRVDIEVRRCRDDGSMICLSVADNGPGIPTENLESVFEPFVQLDRTRSSSVEGSGLGLSISRDLARGMGGDLRAIAGRGVGAMLVLRLPAAPEPA